MLERLFEKLNLGTIHEVREVKGGLLHSMYYVRTEEEAYAVKKLNDRIMKKTNIVESYENTEKFASFACKHLKGISALYFDKYVQQTADGYFILYPWFDGENKTTFTTEDVRKVGKSLAELHQLNYDSKTLKIEHAPTDWTQFSNLNEGKTSLLEGLEADLIEIETTHIYSHRDMDPKNIMWFCDEPYIIDWESSHYIDPRLDLLEGAVYFSYEKECYREELFLSYLEGYFSVQKLSELEEMLPYIFLSKLDWLKHLLLRGTDVDIEEMIQLIERTSLYVNHFQKWIQKIK